MTFPSQTAQQTPQRQAWTGPELAILSEARSKLQRQQTTHVLIAIAGAIATGASFLLSHNGGGIVFFGALIAGPLYALQAQRRLQHLDKLAPGMALNARTLGVRTSVDPPRRSQRKAAIVLMSLMGVVVLAMVIMVLKYA